MSRLDPATIARAILTAPRWARLGITAPKPFLREDAAEELARSILASVGAAEAGGEGQLPLALSGRLDGG